MDNEAVQENADKPKGEAVPATFWDFVKDFTLPAVAYLSGAALCFYVIGTFGLSLWISVPLALVAGAFFFAFFLWGQVASTGMEINIASVIYLVLVVILIPVIGRAHETRLGKEARRQVASKAASPAK